MVSGRVCCARFVGFLAVFPTSAVAASDLLSPVVLALALVGWLGLVSTPGPFRPIVPQKPFFPLLPHQVCGPPRRGPPPCSIGLAPVCRRASCHAPRIFRQKEVPVRTTIPTRHTHCPTGSTQQKYIRAKHA